MATTAEEVWQLLGELIEAQKETERRFEETERLIKEQNQATERRFQETERFLKEQSLESKQHFEETERLIKEQNRETERRFQETERQLKEQSQETGRLLQESSKRLDEQLGKLGNRLGEFVEYQVRPAAVRLFRERGIEVKEISSDVSLQTGQDGIEIDILVVNTTQVIAIEVKSKLSQDQVDEHLERLAKFKRLLPRYQPFQLLGAVAAMVIPADVARYAYRQGLFVIAQSGEDLTILNDEKFQPKIW